MKRAHSDQHSCTEWWMELKREKCTDSYRPYYAS